MAGYHEEVKVFGVWGSPFSKRVEIALHLKGVPYKYFEEDIYNKKSDDLLKYNPIHKKVPVLVHNERPLAESLIILEYIDETWKNNPFLPKDPYERAQTRFWAKFLDDKVLPAIWNACWCDEKEREQAVKEAGELLQILEKEIKEKKFFGGESVGMVDIAGDFIAHWLPVIQQLVGLELVTSEKCPKLHKWSQEIGSHPIIKEKLPLKDKLTAFFKARIEGKIASK